MITKLLPLLIGTCIDLLAGDPHEIPHPVVWIGHLITFLEKSLRKIFPGTSAGEKAAGAALWILVTGISAGSSWLILHLCGMISPWLRIAAESVMCWQILAIRSCANFPGLGPGWYRTAVRLHDENEILISRIRRIVEGGA